MKQSKFNKETYQPSDDEYRKLVETQRNYHRANAYLEKKGDLDVSDPQELLPEDYQAELDKDPGYQKWLDEIDQTPF